MPKDFEQKYHSIITDSFYTSLEVCSYMSSKGFNYIGMAKKNRVGMSWEMRSNNPTQGKSLFYEKDDMILAKFQEKRDMTLLSNIKNNQLIDDFYRKKYVEIKKPFLI